MRRSFVTTACLMVFLIDAKAARAQNYNTPMMQYLGYTQLYTQYGVSLADGSNVSVAQVEAGATSNSVYGAYANTADGRFAAKTMTATSTYDTTDPSGHATTVGALFFGNSTGYSQRSVAPNLGAASDGSSVQMYSYSEFLGPYLLEPGSPAPYGSPNNARVATHAYNDGNLSLDTIERLDYLEQRDDFIQVVPNNGYGQMGDTMNGIVVVSSDGTTTTTDGFNTGNGMPYTASRADPTITGPFPGSPSDAIGQVAGVVGLLVSEGELTHSYNSFTTASTTAIPAPYNGSNFTPYTKAGYTVQSGATADVVKAALMAGAVRNAPANGTLSINGISNYGAASYLTANGLDIRWGAGMVNAYNSYQIVAAGQQLAVEDGGTKIGSQGFDYVPHFGGANSSQTTSTYVFAPTASGTLAISLVWNVNIAGGTSSFSDQATLYNLNLKLIDVTAGGAPVASSASLVDNTQNIYTNITAGHTYDIEVGTTSASFDWDYGIAWQEIPTPEPASLGMLAAAALLMGRRARSRAHHVALHS